MNSASSTCRRASALLGVREGDDRNCEASCRSSLFTFKLRAWMLTKLRLDDWEAFCDASPHFSCPNTSACRNRGKVNIVRRLESSLTASWPSSRVVTPLMMSRSNEALAVPPVGEAGNNKQSSRFAILAAATELHLELLDLCLTCA